VANERASSKVRTGGEALAAQLAVEGVRHVFGLPGDQIMHGLDGLFRQPEIDFITTRHEQGTTYMADGYARTGGEPGVAFVVPGVGVYNAAAGLATAYASSSPVMLIAGQINRHGIGDRLDLLHEVQDQLDLVRPITAWQRRALQACELPSAVHGGFEHLREGRRRPVEIEMPPEALSEQTTVELLPAATDQRFGADPAAVTRAAAALAAAERPLIWAGGGVLLADASAALTAVADQLQAAVVTTREGKGAIDERHPLSVGTTWANKFMLPVIADADVVLAVGTRFSNHGTTPHQTVVQIDVDPDEVGRRRAVVPLLGDARLVLEQLLGELEGHRRVRHSRADETSAMRVAATEGLRAVGPQAGMVDTLRAAIPDDGILVTCTTSMAYMCHMRFPVFAPRTYLTTSYMGTLGFGFPAALGAKVARPGTPVVCVTGDGGFLFAASELATAVQYGINTVTVVYNDGAYGNSNRDQQERFGGREIGTRLRNPDFARLAESFGADGIKLAHHREVGPVLAAAIANDRPTVIEVPIERLPSPF
jgi:acetolactate synthase-1/2/3 large subunit